MRRIILIGAARSGTKLLRDVIAEHPEVGAVPFDINYLWRLGHDELPHDAIPAPLSARAVSAVSKEMQKPGTGVVIEKTVSNCLRVPAIAAAFPDASYVFLLRDGFDVCESSMRQWQAPVDWRYSIKKAMTFPWFKAPGYAAKHLRASLTRTSTESSSTWGPRYPGIDADVKNHSLALVCALQWQACILEACGGFTAAGIKPTIVRYEDFVTEPVATVNSLHVAHQLAPVSGIGRLVQSSEIGKGQRGLTASDLTQIAPLIEATNEKLNDWNASQ